MSSDTMQFEHLDALRCYTGKRVNFLFGSTENQTVKQLKKNVAILMENQDLQQSPIESNAWALNIIKNHLAKSRYMIYRLVDTLKSTTNTEYHSNLLIKRLN